MLLDVRDLEVGYSKVQVLRKVSISVDDGECVGLLGPNGHGKTTLLRTISGLVQPWSGEITYLGKRLDGLTPWEIVKQGIIHVPQGSTLFPRMTVYENLLLGTYARTSRKNLNELLDRVYALFPRLAERRSQLCRTLSGGERQMLAMGVGLMGNAKVLMLDEPTLGLAPNLKEELYAAIGRIVASRLPVILVEQDVEFLLELTQRFYLIENGEVRMDSRQGDLIDHARIQEMYFGKVGT